MPQEPQTLEPQPLKLPPHWSELVALPSWKTHDTDTRRRLAKGYADHVRAAVLQSGRPWTDAAEGTLRTDLDAFAKAGEFEVGEFEAIPQALQRGYQQARSGLQVVQGLDDPENRLDLAEAQLALRDLPDAPPGMRAFQQAEGFGPALAAFARNPVEVPSQILAENAANMVPSLALGYAGAKTGAATGAAIGGAPTAGAAAPPGAIVGAMIGGSLGTFLGSYKTEEANRVLGYLANEHQVDLTKPDQVALAWSNPQIREDVESKAAAGAFATAAFDAATYPLAGRFMGKAAPTTTAKTIGLLKDSAVQGAGGGLGSVAGSLATGEDVNAQDVIGEVLGEAATLPLEARGIPRDIAVQVETARRQRADDLNRKATAAAQGAEAPSPNTQAPSAALDSPEARSLKKRIEAIKRIMAGEKSKSALYQYADTIKQLEDELAQLPSPPTEAPVPTPSATPAAKPAAPAPGSSRHERNVQAMAAGAARLKERKEAEIAATATIPDYQASTGLEYQDAVDALWPAILKGYSKGFITVSQVQDPLLRKRLANEIRSNKELDEARVELAAAQKEAERKATVAGQGLTAEQWREKLDAEPIVPLTEVDRLRQQAGGAQTDLFATDPAAAEAAAQKARTKFKALALDRLGEMGFTPEEIDRVTARDTRKLEVMLTNPDGARAYLEKLATDDATRAAERATAQAAQLEQWKQTPPERLTVEQWQAAQRPDLDPDEARRQHWKLLEKALYAKTITPDEIPDTGHRVRLAQTEENLTRRVDAQREADLANPASKLFRSLPPEEQDARREMLTTKAEYEASTAAFGDDLAAVLDSGALPLPSLDRLAQHPEGLKAPGAAELRDGFLSQLTPAQRLKWTRRNAPVDLDRVRAAAVEMGFDFATTGDLADALAAVARGERVNPTLPPGSDQVTGQWTTSKPFAFDLEAAIERAKLNRGRAVSPTPPQAEYTPPPQTYASDDDLPFSRPTGRWAPPPPLPENLRREIEAEMQRELSPFGITAKLHNSTAEAKAAVPGYNLTDVGEGFWDANTRTSHVIWENLSPRARSSDRHRVDAARRVSMHELGHADLAEFLGDDYQPTLRQAIEAVPNRTLLDILVRYGDLVSPAARAFQPDRAAYLAQLTPEDISTIGEEIVAEIAERPDIAPSLWERIKEFVRRYARKLGLNLQLTDDDIRVLVQRKREWMQNRAAAPQGAETPSAKDQAPRKSAPRYSYAGPAADLTLAQRDALTAAQAMQAAGKDPETIRALTGWFPGKYDGKLRYEVPDKEAKLKPNFKALEKNEISGRRISSVDYVQNGDAWSIMLMPKDAKVVADIVSLENIPADLVRALVPAPIWSKMQKGEGADSLMGNNLEIPSKLITDEFEAGGFNALPLSEVLNHKKLFAAYPQAADVYVNVDNTMLSGGSFGALENGGFLITLGRAGQLSTLLHEIQHWIQNREGFAKGGNINQFEEIDRHGDLLQNVYDERSRRFQLIPERFQELARMRNRGEPIPPDDMRALQSDPAAKLAWANWLQADRDATELQNLPADQRLAPLTRFEQYRNVAGEIEARDVQARQNLTPEQRQATPPFSSENIPAENAIVRFSRAQSTLALDTPLGTQLPADLAGIVPNYQDHPVRFAAPLDKWLYYATPSEERTTKHDARLKALAQETGLPESRLRALGRELRQRLGQLAAPLPESETIRAPEFLPAIVAGETGVRFSRAQKSPGEEITLQSGESSFDSDRIASISSTSTGPRRGSDKTKPMASREVNREIRQSRAVTPEQDRAYLDAVTRGDVAQAQRLVDQAAKSAGYDPEITLYFGAREKGFLVKDIGDSIFLTDDFDAAKDYAHSTNTPQAFYLSGLVTNIEDLEFDWSSPRWREYHLDGETDASDLDLGQLLGNRNHRAQIASELRQQGFSAMQFSGDVSSNRQIEHDSWLVVNANNIKSADAITRDDQGNVIPLSQRFNEQTPDIRFSRAPAPKSQITNLKSQSPGEPPALSGEELAKEAVSERHALAATATHATRPWVKRFLESFEATVKRFRKHPELKISDPRWVGFREGYRDLQSSGEIIGRETTEQVRHILEPILALGKEAVDPDTYAIAQKAYQRVRERELDLKDAEARLAESPADPGKQYRVNAAREKLQSEKHKADLATIREIDQKLEGLPYHLFRKYVMYTDLVYRYEMEVEVAPARDGKPALNRPLKATGPRDVTKEDDSGVTMAKREWERLGNLIAAHPQKVEIEKSLDRHYEAMEAMQEELIRRGYLIPEEYRNPFYFPHHILDFHNGALGQPNFTTEDPFRGYLENPVGSPRDVEADYLKAVYQHLYLARRHNTEQTFVERHVLSQDITEKIRLQLQEDHDAKVAERKAFPRTITRDEAQQDQNIPEGFERFIVDKRLPMTPVQVLDPKKLAEALGTTLAEDEDAAQMIARLGGDVRLTVDMLKTILAQRPGESIVIPGPMARELKGLLERGAREIEAKSVYEAAARGFVSWWKKVKLFLPTNVIRYTWGNLTTDVISKWLTTNPKLAKYFGESIRELRAVANGEAPSPRMLAAIRAGVLDSLTDNEARMTADLPWQDEFAEFQTLPATWWSRVKRYTGEGGAKLPKLWERFIRYARYLQAMDDLAADPAAANYGGARRDYVRQIGESAPGAGDARERQAARIARDTFVDYADIGVQGDWLRKNLMPFYSWTEGNAKYHLNLFRNAWIKGREATPPGTPTAYRISANLAALVAQLSAPWILFYIWNHRDDEAEELEKGLSAEDRRRLHLTLGRDESGKIRLIYLPEAMDDMLGWIGGQTLIQQVPALMRGETTIGNAMSEMKTAAINKAAGSINPLIKGGYEAVSGKTTFPDILDQRTIPAYDKWWKLLGNLTDDNAVTGIRAFADKDFYATKSAWETASQMFLQVRGRDPESWAYYTIREKADEFADAKTGGSREPGSVDLPHLQTLRNFRRALYTGDLENAHRFYVRLLDFGYTAEKMEASIRGQHPLASLRKDYQKEFLASLSDHDQWQYKQALAHYAKIEQLKGKGARLFPTEKLPLPAQERRREALKMNPPPLTTSKPNPWLPSTK